MIWLTLVTSGMHTPKNSDSEEPKLCDFSYISKYGKPSNTLLGAQNGENRGSYSIFVVICTNFRITKFVFWPSLRLKVFIGEGGKRPPPYRS